MILPTGWYICFSIDNCHIFMKEGLPIIAKNREVKAYGKGLDF
jgi:hypothetical protein